MSRTLPALACFIALFGFVSAADDADPIAKALDAAKATYKADGANWVVAVKDWIDGREEAARKDGNKKAVDRIKSELQAFQDTGELPQGIPSEFGKRRIASRKALTTAYETAIRDYTKAKRDEEAGAVERELKEYLASATAKIESKKPAADFKPAVKLPEGYKLIWNDEFDGTELDAKKWILNEGKWNGHPLSKKAVALDGKGHLVLSSLKVGDAFQGGEARTVDAFKWKYGYFEARVKSQQLEGQYTNFGLTGGGSSWISVFHYQNLSAEDLGSLTIHFGERKNGVIRNATNPESFAKASGKAVRGLGEDYHVHGLLWTETEYAFFMDGTEIYRTKEGKIDKAMAVVLLFSEERKRPTGESKKAPYCMTVDYVRVFGKD